LLEFGVTPDFLFPIPRLFSTMKASLLFGATLLSISAFAFPANLLNGDISEEALAEISALAAKITREAKTKRQLDIVKPGFNADAQRISTTGKHQYVCGPIKVEEIGAAKLLTASVQIAPGPNDTRGPCPGLNVMANHGYISRDGVPSVVELTTASNLGTHALAPLSAQS
jgi:hypothetical protein